MVENHFPLLHLLSHLVPLMHSIHFLFIQGLEVVANTRYFSVPLHLLLIMRAQMTPLPHSLLFLCRNLSAKSKPVATRSCRRLTMIVQARAMIRRMLLFLSYLFRMVFLICCSRILPWIRLFPCTCLPFSSKQSRQALRNAQQHDFLNLKFR